MFLKILHFDNHTNNNKVLILLVIIQSFKTFEIDFHFNDNK
jgi:hypothetical protein